MRLIDADKIGLTDFEIVICKGLYKNALGAIIDKISNAPTIDAVPVVRCKDCKHKPSGTGANHDLEFPDGVCPCQCEDFWYSWKPDDDWFCKDGERKEE